MPRDWFKGKRMLLPIHVAAGGLAIVLGAVALSVKKGGTIHRRSGLLFVYAMLVMASSGSIMALRNGVSDGNVMGGLMTAYFVGTALTTVRPASPRARVARILPEPFTTGPMRALPILLLFGTMFYWLWRVRGRRTLPLPVRDEPMPLATRAS
jgi:uncharacterized membrane protein